MRKRMNRKGFTLIELMIATMIFSTILLAVMTVMLQLGRIYYKGVITNRTQETMRSVADEISQQLQFGADTVRYGTQKYGDLDVSAFCIGDQRYSYVVNAKVTSGTNSTAPTSANGHALQHALWRDTVVSQGDCAPLNLSQKDPTDPSGNASVNGRELLSQNMRLSANFEAPSCPEGSSMCEFTVAIIYGDDDLLAPDANNPVACGNIAGSQWCAASSSSIQVFKRLEQAN